VKSSAFTCVYYCLTEGSIIPSFGFPDLMVIHGQLIPLGIPVPSLFALLKRRLVTFRNFSNWSFHHGASLSLLARPREQFSLNALVSHESSTAATSSRVLRIFPSNWISQ